MRFVIHIGTHKTGTSSIQAFCRDNRDVLITHGVYYPTNKSSSRNFNFLAAEIAFGDIEKTREFLSSAIKRAEKLGAHTILLSAESFYAMTSFFYCLYDRPCDEYWASEKNFINKVRSLFPGDDIEVICLLRRQDLFLESIYNQCVKHSPGFAGDIREFNHVMGETLDYAGHLNLWAEAFGNENITIVNFDSISDRLIEDFLNVSLGIEDINGFHFSYVKKNERLNRDVLEYKRKLNKNPMPRVDAVSLMISMMKISDQIGDLDTYQTFISINERIELLSKYEQGNKTLLNIFIKNRKVDFFKSLDQDEFTEDIYTGMSENKEQEIVKLHHELKNSFWYKLEITLRRVAYYLDGNFPFITPALNMVRFFRNHINPK